VTPLLFNSQLECGFLSDNIIMITFGLCRFQRWDTGAGGCGLYHREG